MELVNFIFEDHPDAFEIFAGKKFIVTRVYCWQILSAEPFQVFNFNKQYRSPIVNIQKFACRFSALIICIKTCLHWLVAVLRPSFPIERPYLQELGSSVLHPASHKRKFRMLTPEATNPPKNALHAQVIWNSKRENILNILETTWADNLLLFHRRTDRLIQCPFLYLIQLDNPRQPHSFCVCFLLVHTNNDQSPSTVECFDFNPKHHLSIMRSCLLTPNQRKGLRLPSSWEKNR